jgi:hypothetical protein
MLPNSFFASASGSTATSAAGSRISAAGMSVGSAPQRVVMPPAPMLAPKATHGLAGESVGLVAAPFEITDIHLKLEDPAGSLIYPGPRRALGTELALATSLCVTVAEVKRKDFLIDHEGVFWRGRRDSQAVDGQWVRLRRMQGAPPQLSALPSPMPSGIVKALMSPQLSRGGLIYVCGGTGAGKTTTASGIVVSRLMQFGGLAYTVEEPPELPLNGWHGNGYCTQTWVAGDESADWTESMRGVLRSQPAKTPVMLYIGEVRDAETGKALVRAANNGFLVVATGFGSDIRSGLESFCTLVGADQLSSVAGCLKAVVYQQLEPRFFAQLVVSTSHASPLALQVKRGAFAEIENEIAQQHVHLVNGGDLWTSR